MLILRRANLSKPLCRFVQQDSVDTRVKPIEIQTVPVPDECPDIPKERVFQQITKPSCEVPVTSLEQATKPIDKYFLTKYHRYPSLLDDYSNLNYALRGVDNKDTTISHFPCATDLLMVGGGLIGSACAYYCKKQLSKAGDVLVLDKDPYSPHNCTALCNGLLSSQSKSRDISRIASLSKELIRALRTDVLMTPEYYAQIKYRPCTHLILWPERYVSEVMESIDLQIEDGLYTETKLPHELEAHFPWMKVANSDVFIGTHGNQDEALIDPIGLRNVYRTLAQAHGANFVLGEAIDFNTIHDYEDTCLTPLSAGAMVARNCANGELKSVGFAHTLLSLGHNTPYLEARAEMEHHMKDQFNDMHFLQPKLRIQITFQSLNAPSINFPVITDTDGSILIKDDFAGDFKLCLPYEESEKFYEFDVQLMDLDSEEPYKNYYHKGAVFENYFEENVKPRLVKRIPSMKDAKFLIALSGFESYNIHDGCPVISDHPYHEKIHLSGGYGSRMMTFAPTAAAMISETFRRIEEPFFDLSSFSWARVFQNRKMCEFDLLIR